MKQKIFSALTWLPVELAKTLSNIDSFFSLKRIERVVCFATAIYFEWQYFKIHRENLTIQDFLALVLPLFTMAGLSLTATQKEKENENIVPTQPEQKEKNDA